MKNGKEIVVDTEVLKEIKIRRKNIRYGIDLNFLINESWDNDIEYRGIYIYKITNKLNNKSYIGQTNSSPMHRFVRHYAEDGCPKIHRAIRSIEIENFTMEIIYFAFDRDHGDAMEEHFVELYDSINSGYNLKTGGNRGKHSDEVKQKMSITRKGSKRSEEACKIISESKIGDKNPMWGKKHSEEHKAKIAKSVSENNYFFLKKGDMRKRGEDSHKAKLTNKQVREIKYLLQTTDWSCKVIGDIFECPRQTISQIKFERSWTHISWFFPVIRNAPNKP